MSYIHYLILDIKIALLGLSLAGFAVLMYALATGFRD